jgi:hypothetical protein
LISDNSEVLTDLIIDCYLTTASINLQKEIEDSKRWIELEKDESTYKQDLRKRIELINWTLENMKNQDTNICKIIESRMSEIILKINKTHSIFESNKLHIELRILDWILYQVCRNEIKKFEGV